MAETAIVEGYCVKDKRKVAIKNGSEIVMKNGRHAMAGVCPVCGTKVFRIL